MLECGLIPRGADEQRKVLDMVASEDLDCSGNGLPFVPFLMWIDTVRQQCVESLRKELKDTYSVIDEDKDGLVKRCEITRMLTVNGSLGLQPHSPQDQDAMQKLLDETEAGNADPKGYDFDEFLDLLQRATEHLRRSWARHEVEEGAKFGFERRQVSELRAVFFKLTNSQRGVTGALLSLSECQRIRVFIKTLSSRALAEIFKKADIAENHAIDFEGFLLLMSMAMPKETRASVAMDISLL